MIAHSVSKEILFSLEFHKVLFILKRTRHFQKKSLYSKGRWERNFCLNFSNPLVHFPISLLKKFLANLFKVSNTRIKKRQKHFSPKAITLGELLDEKIISEFFNIFRLFFWISSFINRESILENIKPLNSPQMLQNCISLSLILSLLSSVCLWKVYKNLFDYKRLSFRVFLKEKNYFI